MTKTLDLEGWIKRKKLTRKQLAGLMGISPMSLYRKIHNRSDFRAEEIASLTRILQLSRRDRDYLFFDGTGDAKSRKVTPRKIGSLKGQWLYGGGEPELPGQLCLEEQMGAPSSGRDGLLSTAEGDGCNKPGRDIGRDPQGGGAEPADGGGASHRSGAAHRREVSHQGEAAHRREASHRRETSHQGEAAHRREASHRSGAAHRRETSHRGEATYRRETSRRGKRLEQGRAVSPGTGPAGREGHSLSSGRRAGRGQDNLPSAAEGAKQRV